MFRTYPFAFRGDRASLNMLRGKVVDHREWTTSDVQGSGGGGYLSGGTGHISNVKITTTHTTHTQFFVRDADGQEVSVRLDDTPLDLRNDHEATLVWIVREGDAQGPYLFVVNHSLRAVNRLERGFSQLNWLNWKDNKKNWPAGVGAALGIALLFVRWYLGLAVLVPIAVWAYLSSNEDDRKLASEINRLMREAGTEGYVTHTIGISWREQLQPR